MSLITAAYAADAAGGAGGEGSIMGSFLVVGGFLAIFYFLILRPQNQKAKEHEELLTNLRNGDEVVTSGGIVGRISKIRDDFLVLTLTEGVEITVQKSAIKASLPKGSIKTL